jgi:hypothetical protein
VKIGDRILLDNDTLIINGQATAEIGLDAPPKN